MDVFWRLIERVRVALGGVFTALEPLISPVRTAVSPITALGWTLVFIGGVAWVVGARLGWEELLILSGATIVIVVLSLAMTLGRLGLDIEISVQPERLEVGGDAVGAVRVSTHRATVSLGTEVEVPVGRGVASFSVGALGRDATFEDVFVVPTNRRAIVPIGPARSVKGDPLGIARREVTGGERIELFVHPRTVALPGFSAGFLRDLEGRTTPDLSPSDIAFHTLREYEIGDDLRHVHWLTSAKMLSANESATLMVRQFVDTRRSHLGLVLSPDSTDWADEDEFEFGVEIFASLGRGGLMDGQRLSAVCGSTPLPAGSPQLLLDALSGVDVERDGLPLRELANRSLAYTRGSSIVGLVVGSAVERSIVRAACDTFRSDAMVLAFCCRPGAEVTMQTAKNVTVVEIGSLDDLPRLMGTL